MLNQIQIKLEKELDIHIKKTGRIYFNGIIPAHIIRQIQKFILRKGKRIRPVLFILSYKGFSNKSPENLYTSALSFEILHNFILIHDDIIDKSKKRRGEPCLHITLKKDTAIVIGDILYTLAINTFLSINENPNSKLHALDLLTQAGITTGLGELKELAYDKTPINKVTKSAIYRIYDYKTAYYSFIAPLCAGAILAGAKSSDIANLKKYGLYTGRAFQINDDINGIFADERKTGKSSALDLQQAKKTLIIWHAYRNASGSDKSIIEKMLSKNKILKTDLAKIREIILSTKSLDFARSEISKFTTQAQSYLHRTKMSEKYKMMMMEFMQKNF